jgi:hypothetical protein
VRFVPGIGLKGLVFIMKMNVYRGFYIPEV